MGEILSAIGSNDILGQELYSKIQKEILDVLAREKKMYLYRVVERLYGIGQLYGIGVLGNLCKKWIGKISELQLRFLEDDIEFLDACEGSASSRCSENKNSEKVCKIIDRALGFDTTIEIESAKFKIKFGEILGI